MRQNENDTIENLIFMCTFCLLSNIVTEIYMAIMFSIIGCVFAFKYFNSKI